MSVLLVDSTLYIDLLRARQDPVEVLKPWLLRDEVLCCGVIRCEVLRGILSEKVHERMKALFEAVHTVSTDETV